MRVVIDTKVLVSAFLSPDGIPAEIMRRLQRDAFEFLVSEPILAEYRRALGYPKVQARHGLDNFALHGVIESLRVLAELIDPPTGVEVVDNDPDDNKFLACAVGGSADYIISGDRAVLAVGEYRGIRVLSAAVFIALLDNDSVHD
jgi:uncharacterized protein